MNTQILKKAEKNFLTKYPGGFNHEEMLKIGKKHKMDKLEADAKAFFAKAEFAKPETIVENSAKMVSRSTMVSMFEKPKFRDTTKAFNKEDKATLANAIYDLLHGKQKAGFEALVDLLAEYKLAKWSLVTVIPAYYKPQKEVFVKPTTAKLIVEKLELDLEYKPKPTWDFYSKYRKAITEMKKQVSSDLAPNNPAFSGFLMTSLPEDS